MRYVEPGSSPQYSSGNYDENILSILLFSVPLTCTSLLASRVPLGFLTQLIHSHPLHWPVLGLFILVMLDYDHKLLSSSICTLVHPPPLSLSCSQVFSLAVCSPISSVS
jgi:hypothetical protein